MGTHTVHYYNPTGKSLDLKDGRKMDLLPGEIARTDALSELTRYPDNQLS